VSLLTGKPAPEELRSRTETHAPRAMSETRAKIEDVMAQIKSNAGKDVNIKIDDSRSKADMLKILEHALYGGHRAVA
jgi:hypothetical protein